MKEEEILLTMSCHGGVLSVYTVHPVSTQFPAFLGLPALPLAAVLSWQGEEAANGRGHRVQYVRHTQIVGQQPMAMWAQLKQKMQQFRQVEFDSNNGR